MSEFVSVICLSLGLISLALAVMMHGNWIKDVSDRVRKLERESK